MIGNTNVNGGGGLTGNKALLKIKAPTGSTITVSKDGFSKIIKVNNIDALNSYWSWWFFETVDYGTWTVTATSGTQTASDTVLIASNKEYEIELSFQLVLFENGTWADITGGITSTQCTIVDGDLRSIGSYNSVGKWCANNQIDVSNYTTLRMLSKVVSGSSSYKMWFGTSDSNNIPSSNSSWGASLFTAYYSNTFSSAESDYTLKSIDISAASTLSYIKFGYYQETLTKRIWLE